MGAPREAASLRPHPVTVEEMLDNFALQHLAWTYCHAVDRRDFALLRSLYHDDAFDDHGPMFRGGADEFVAWLPSILATWGATSHVIDNMLFLIEGDHAEGELTATAYHRTKDGGRELIIHGRYIDQYKKRQGAWRYFRRSLVLDWVEDRPVQKAHEPGVDDGVELGRPSGCDPCYRRLPLFAAQRADGSGRRGPP